MSPSHSTTQQLLNRASLALSWARMSLKPSKSRTITIENGKVSKTSKLSLTQDGQHQEIPSIFENPIKFLGRQISSSLNDQCQVKNFSEALSKGLLLIDKSSHRDIHKLWILQHLRIPCLQWPLLIYEIPLSAVVKFKQKISVYYVSGFTSIVLQQTFVFIPPPHHVHFLLKVCHQLGSLQKLVANSFSETHMTLSFQNQMFL